VSHPTLEAPAELLQFPNEDGRRSLVRRGPAKCRLTDVDRRTLELALARRPDRLVARFEIDGGDEWVWILRDRADPDVLAVWLIGWNGRVLTLTEVASGQEMGRSVELADLLPIMGLA